MKKAFLGLSFLIAAVNANAAAVTGIPSYDITASGANFSFNAGAATQFLELQVNQTTTTIDFSRIAGNISFALFADTDGLLNGAATFDSATPVATIALTATNTISSLALATGNYVLRLNASRNPGSASASVASVPVPAAAWLFGSALVGIGAIRRKKQAMFA